MSSVSTRMNYRVLAYWFQDAEVILQVDSDVLTPTLAAEINGFWSDADSRLSYEGGDVVRAVVRMFGTAAIRFFIDDGGADLSLSPEGYRHSTKEVLKAQHEGWPDIDGLGILITMAHVSVVDYEDVTLEVLHEKL